MGKVEARERYRSETPCFSQQRRVVVSDYRQFITSSLSCVRQEEVVHENCRMKVNMYPLL